MGFSDCDSRLYILISTISKKLNKDSIWSLLGGGVPALFGLLSVPIFIHLLTIDEFAFVSLLLSLTLFFYVYDLGLMRSMHFYVPKNNYANYNARVSLLTNTLLISIVSSLIITTALLMTTKTLVADWIKVDSSFSDSAVLAMKLTVVGITPALMINVLKGYLEARQLFRDANLAKIFSGVTLFIFPLTVFIMTSSIASVGGALLLSRVTSLFFYIWVTQKDTNLMVFIVDKTIIKNIISYSFWAAISGFFATLFIYGDRFIVAGYISAAELSVYIASQDVLIRYLLLPWSLSIVLVPYFATDTYVTKYSKLYKKTKNKIILMTVIFCMVSIPITYFLIPYYIGDELIYSTQKVLLILIFGVVFAAFSQLPLLYLYAKNKAKLISFIFIGEGLAYIAFSPFIFSNYGVLGAALLWTMRLFVELILLSYYSNKIIKNGL